MTEEKSLFRKEALDRINSPEKMNEYIHVTGPGKWILIAACAVFFAGLFIWALLGRVETVRKTAVYVDDEGAICCIRAQDIDDLTDGMELRLSDGTVSRLGKIEDAEPAKLNDTQKAYLSDVLHTETAEYYLMIPLEGLEKKPGYYKGEIILEQIKPIAFLFPDRQAQL